MAVSSQNFLLPPHRYLAFIFASPADICLHWRGIIPRDLERFMPSEAGSPAAFEASHLSALPSLLLSSLSPAFIIILVCALCKATGSTKVSSSQLLVLGLSKFPLVCIKKKATESKMLLSYCPEDFCCAGLAHRVRMNVMWLALPTA